MYSIEGYRYNTNRSLECTHQLRITVNGDTVKDVPARVGTSSFDPEGTKISYRYPSEASLMEKLAPYFTDPKKQSSRTAARSITDTLGKDVVTLAEPFMMNNGKEDITVKFQLSRIAHNSCSIGIAGNGTDIEGKYYALDPPVHFNGVAPQVDSALTIIPLTQIIRTLGYRNSISVNEKLAFTAPQEAAETFVDSVKTWAAQPERGSMVSAVYTDTNGRVARITLYCPDATTFPADTFPKVSVSSLLCAQEPDPC